jgi:hypothetical protein
MSGTLFSAILMTARVVEEVIGASLSTPESFLPLSTAGVSATARVWLVSMAMERELGAAQQVAKGSSKRLEGERAEVMGLDALSNALLYMRSRRQYDDSLLEKKDVFLFQPPAQSRRGIKETKSLEV